MNVNAFAAQPKPQTLWGRVGDKEVWLFCLENNRGTRLFVSNYGATAQALIFQDDQQGQLDVLLGYDNLEAYQSDKFYMGAVVGRYANRIGSGQILVNGIKHNLSLSDGGYHLHGGYEGFNKKIFSVNTSKTNRLVLGYRSPNGDEGFPGNLDVEVEYSLDDEDCWTVEYRALADATTLVNLTQHAYFNLSGQPMQGIADHRLKMYGQYFLPVNDLQLPTGELRPVIGTAFDFKSFTTLGASSSIDDTQLRTSGGFDHSFVLENKRTPYLKKAASVQEPIGGRQMDVFTTEPAVHFYAGNYLNGTRGKNGAFYTARSGFCLETGNFPDAPNHRHFPSSVLKAGEEFYSKTVFRFSRRQQSK